MSTYRNSECERFIGEWNEADGFFGANCGTWVGGFSANCKSQQQAAMMNRASCYDIKNVQERNDRLTKQVMTVGMWVGIGVLVFFVLKWYLK